MLLRRDEDDGVRIARRMMWTVAAEHRRRKICEALVGTMEKDKMQDAPSTHWTLLSDAACALFARYMNQNKTLRKALTNNPVLRRHRGLQSNGQS
jgi:hypothetical protein